MDGLFWPIFISAVTVELLARIVTTVKLFNTQKAPQFFKRSTWVYIIWIPLFGWVFYQAIHLKKPDIN